MPPVKNASTSALSAAGAALVGSQGPGPSASPAAKAKAKASTAADELAVLLDAAPGAAPAAAPAAAAPTAISAAPPPASGASAGALGVRRAKLEQPVPFEVAGEASLPSDEALASAAGVGPVRGWRCRATLNGEVWEIHVRGVSAPSGGGGKVALCLHGLGQDRCGAFWMKFWPALCEAGYDILALDMPGHGASCERPLPARASQDELLVLAVVAAFTDQTPGQVCCFADTGGAAAFMRAYALQPDVFAGHHVLSNPIIGTIPDALKTALEHEGTDLKVFFADGWAKSDQPFTIATSGVFLEYLEQIGDRIDYLFHKAPGMTAKTPGIPPPTKPPEYLAGAPITVAGVSRNRTFFCLTPCEECVSDVMAYLQAPRRAPVKEASLISAPQMTALERGEVNETFRVFVRVRPYLQREEKAGSKPCVSVKDVEDFPRDPPPQRIQIRDPSGTRHASVGGDFVFDRVFEPGSQDDVFDSVGKPLVQTMFQGSNVTMFAYGQTGTGKTFTMEGPPGQEGLIHKCIHLLFSGKSSTQSVYFQYVQLYNEDFKDLLDPDSHKKLAVEEGPNFMQVRGAIMAEAASPEAMLQQVAVGASFRASGKTNMNDASSRSHAILSVVLSESEPEKGSAMYLVDLAGSERVKRSGATGAAFTEAANINMALSALGRVVVGLVENDGKRAAHIAYKDNPLTYLLKSGIGGNSRTALICCITAAEDSLDESLNTLRFALQASHVKNKVAAKEKKDQKAAAASKIEDSANSLELAADGTGTVPLGSGPLDVRGFWPPEPGPAVVCLHDFGQTGAQFDGAIALLKAAGVRVLAPTFSMPTEKPDGHPELIARLLALLDWLGVPAPILFGRDLGAVLCCAFKVAHPTRAGTLVLQNKHQDVDADQFKAKCKKDPNYVMTQYMDCWDWIASVLEADKSKIGANVKKLKGKVVLMWPCHFKGRPDAKQSNSKVAQIVASALRTKLVDSYGWSEEKAIEHLRAMLPNP